MKKRTKIIVIIMLSIIIISRITYAVTIYICESSQVSYDNAISLLEAENVQDALDELYFIANNYKDIIDDLDDLESKLYPVGSIYIGINDTNPSAYFGGTWVSFGTGRTLAGIDTSQTEFNTLEKTGGEKDHTLTTTELPSHTHGSKTLSGYVNFARYGTSGTGTDIVVNSPTGIISRQTQSGANLLNTGGVSVSNPYYDLVTITATHEHTSVGSGGSHNNLQPYITVYMWKRTS